jgi:hypothetical protein
MLAIAKGLANAKNWLQESLIEPYMGPILESLNEVSEEQRKITALATSLDSMVNQNVARINRIEELRVQSDEIQQLLVAQVDILQKDVSRVKGQIEVLISRARILFNSDESVT